MSFFPSSSGVVISGGHFTNITTQDAAQVLGTRKTKDHEFGEYAQADDDPRKRHRSRSLDGLKIVEREEFELHKELIRGISYRIHSASHDGRFVAVKAFEGARAKQDWTVDKAFCKKFLHPNVFKMVGTSDESSKSHFLLFHGVTSEQKMQSLIAKALRTDLNMSVRISMKAVKGLAAGLSYIENQNIPIYPETMSNNWKWENFDIFTGYDNEPVISFDSSSTVQVHEDGSVSQTFDNVIDGRGIEVLTGLCQQLFSGANSILYDDSPEREFVVYDREGFPMATLEDAAEGTSNVSESEDMSGPSNSTENPKPSPTPRREVWWLDLGAKNQSLESIKWRFEDHLNRLLPSSSDSLLRHIASPMDNKLRHNLHQCPGYLREEITLASDVSKSVIVSHAFPSQSEVCSICGQLVQYDDCAASEPSIVDASDEEGEADSQNGSHHLPQLEPSTIPSPHSPIVGPPSPVSLDVSDSASILIPPSSPPSNHGHPFMTTLQLIDDRPDEKFGLFSPDVLNTFTLHRRESFDSDTDSLADPDFIAWGPPTLSSRSVHFVSDTHQLRDDKPEEKSGLSSQNPHNSDRFRPQPKLSVASGSGRIPQNPTLSNHSGPSQAGPSRSKKPEENIFRKGSNGASSNNAIRTDDLNNYSHKKIPDSSGSIPQNLTGTLSSHSGPSGSGPSHTNKPGKKISRKGSKASSNNVILRTNDLDNNSRTKTPNNSPVGRRSLSGLSSFSDDFQKLFGLKKDRSR